MATCCDRSISRLFLDNRSRASRGHRLDQLLQPRSELVGSDSRDWSVNLKAGYTPTPHNEYTINYMKQSGEKGAPLNVYNTPPDAVSSQMLPEPNIAVVVHWISHDHMH
jgi:hypothetical protein